MRIGILGAGSIGCYVGGRLAHQGADVRLVGRQSLADDVRRAGLSLSDCDGFKATVPATAARVETDARALADRDVVIVTVKTRDTAAAGRELAPHLAPGALVISLQNGVRNAHELAAAMPGARVVAGMVPFNVLRLGNGTFHRGTSGDLLFGEDGRGTARDLAVAMSAAGMPAKVAADLVAVQWGKLLFNLNNALNALAGIPLREQLSQRAYRRVLAAAMDEALVAMRRAEIRPAASLKVPPALVPHVLRLPDALFFRLASTMLKIDPAARSSMWDDLSRGRPTEIDALNGEIVRLAEAHGGRAEVNKRIVTLVKQAEARAAGSPAYAADRLARELGV